MTSWRHSGESSRRIRGDFWYVIKAAKWRAYANFQLSTNFFRSFAYFDWTRLRGDMIEEFKMTHNIYDPDVSLKLDYNLGCSTRGNKYKLLNCTFCHDLQKYYFSARIINIWNSLPNCVVDVSTINQFKARLDKFWMHQDVLYD